MGIGTNLKLALKVRTVHNRRNSYKIALRIIYLKAIISYH